MHTFTAEELALQDREVYKLLVDSVASHHYVDPSDYRHKLTGVLNPDATPYRLPKSYTKYTDIVDCLRHKQYTAYYPQSFVTLPKYFIDENIDPYFSAKPWDDYALGAITIEGMVQLNSNGIPWLLGDPKFIPEIIHYASIYRTTLEPAIGTNPKARQLYNQYADFITEMEAGYDRWRNKELIDQGYSTGPMSLDQMMRNLTRTWN